MRGGDVPYACCLFAVLYDDGSIDWIVERGKLAETVAAVLGDAVRRSRPKTSATFWRRWAGRPGASASGILSRRLRFTTG